MQVKNGNKTSATLSSAGKGVVFINENQRKYCKYMFFVCVREILKILIGNMLNSMKESPTFYICWLCITSWVKRRSDLLYAFSHE